MAGTKYLVKHAVKPYGADHWQLILEGHDPVETTDPSFISGDYVIIDAGTAVKVTKEQRP